MHDNEKFLCLKVTGLYQEDIRKKQIRGAALEKKAYPYALAQPLWCGQYTTYTTMSDSLTRMNTHGKCCIFLVSLFRLPLCLPGECYVLMSFKTPL